MKPVNSLVLGGDLAFHLMTGQNVNQAIFDVNIPECEAEQVLGHIVIRF